MSDLKPGELGVILDGGCYNKSYQGNVVVRSSSYTSTYFQLLGKDNGWDKAPDDVYVRPLKEGDLIELK